MTRHDVYIVSAKRTAITSFLGAFKHVHPSFLSASIIKNIIADNPSLTHAMIDDVIIGHVLQAGFGQNTARQASIMANLGQHVPAMTLNKVCGSGMKALHLGYNAIALGDANIIIAGGHEIMSGAPHLARKVRDGQKMGALALEDSIMLDGLTCAMTDNIHMGITAENLAKKFYISRQEQDNFAYNSQQKASHAQKQGKFASEITPITVTNGRHGDVIIDSDDYIKHDASIDKMATLRPAFLDDGTVTAANASGINDGASIILLASAKACKQYNVTPLARIVAINSVGVAPDIMGYGPVQSSQDIIKKSGWAIHDIDIIESNEAFAAQALTVIKELDLEPSKVNPNGGAIALGHPIGASGARIITTLLHEMLRTKKQKGLATMCIGGGQGISTLIETL